MESFFQFLVSPANRPFIYTLLVVDLIVRGFALWQSARKDQRLWFSALLVVNSLGILPAIYLFLQNRVPPKKATRKKK